MGKTNRGMALLLAFIVATSLLCACKHEHVWTEATCTTPKTCSACGETEGEPLGHSWKEATYNAPKTCTVCGATEGEPKKIEVTALFLDKTSISLDIGENVVLKYTLLPENAPDAGVAWKSINPEIVTVNEQGSVTAVAPGKTTVICSTPNGVFGQCDVEVKEPSAVSMLNELEKKVFDFMTEKMTKYFYNASAVRLRDIFGDVESIDVGFSLYLQGTNKVGGTIYKLYLIATYTDPWTYTDMTSLMNYNGKSMDPNVMDYKKINAALEEYWKEQGM